MAQSKGMDLESQHKAGNVYRNRFARSTGVAQKQVMLQLDELAR